MGVCRQKEESRVRQITRRLEGAKDYGTAKTSGRMSGNYYGRRRRGCLLVSSLPGAESGEKARE